jgi:ribosomal protein S18 acetylase RimI-like enzyme
MWRPMLAFDLKDVNRIAGFVWGEEFFETPEVFEEKLMLFPKGCFVYATDTVQGYAFSHPWHKMNPPKLNSLLGKFIDADVLHIHDISLLPEVRGKGLVNQLMPELEKIAQKYTGMSLVGINNTATLWNKYNFVSILNVDVTQYCNNAVYMLK